MATKGKTRSRLVPFLAPVAVAGLLAAAEHLDLSQQLENVTVDRRFKAREPHDPPVDPRILLVGIGEYSLKQVGRWEEWTRRVHAKFLEQLNLRSPAVVAYDFFFSEPSKDSEGDDAFAGMLELFPGAITGAVADDKSLNAPAYSGETIGKTRPLSRVEGDRTGMVSAPNGRVPIPRIAEGSWTGFVNSPPSIIGGIRRKIPLIVEFGGRVYPAFVLQILMQLEGVGSDDVEVVLGEAVRVNCADGDQVAIPIDGSGFMNLNYRGRSAFSPIEYIGVMKWLSEFESGIEWPESRPPIENQIVLVGQMADGLTDFGPTPFSSREPLVLVQAIALNNILQRDYLQIVPLWQILLGWLPLAWGTLIFLQRSPVFWSATAPVALVAAYVAFAFLLFKEHSLQLPLFLPVTGFLLVHGGALLDRIVLETRAKSRIKNVFGTFAPPQVVDAIIASGEDPKLGGEEVEITAFFSDIQGFSTFSEKLAPEPLVVLMNDYLTALTDVLMAQGGSLDKYIGDAIVGMFGAPMSFPDHAHRACVATIEMQREQTRLRDKWRREGSWPEIVYQMQTRIGLNSGQAVVGHMGSPRRVNYTMMGDTVNLAARCESGAKSYGVYTMVTGETRAGSMQAKDDIAFRYLDKIVVKGRSRPAEIFEVIGFTSELSPRTADCISLYGGGIEKYLARDWDGARSVFEKSAGLETFLPGSLPGVETNPSLVMIGRCRTMKEHPPGEDWDGRYVMTSK